MTRIGIILGSTRPNRNGEQVAKWVYGIASRRSDVAWSSALAPLRQPAAAAAAS